MKPVRILFVRHGETEGNRDRLLQGQNDTPLSDTGKRQAEALGTSLRHFSFDALYSSPLARAYHTARAVAAHHKGIRIRKTTELMEQSFGLYEGKPYEQAVLLYKNGSWEESWLYPDMHSPQGESLNDVALRLRKFFSRVAARHAGKTVVAVTHGNAIRIALHVLAGIPYPMLNHVAINNTSLTMVAYDGTRPAEIVFANFRGHLETVPTTD